MLKNIGPLEILIAGIVLILLFGSKKITDLARGLGEGTKELKKAKSEFEKANSQQVFDESVKKENKEVNNLV